MLRCHAVGDLGSHSQTGLAVRELSPPPIVAGDLPAHRQPTATDVLALLTGMNLIAKRSVWGGVSVSCSSD